MQRLQRSNVVCTRSRVWRVGGFAALVVLAHALLLQWAAQPAAPTAARPRTVEVRRLVLPLAAPALEPAPTAAAQPPATTPVPPPRIAQRPPKRQSVRSDAAEAPPDAARQEQPAAPPLVAPPSVAPAPTRVPPSADLVFTLQSGAQRGEARLAWRADGARYTLSLHATLPSGRDVEQHSEGGFDASGVAPLRLADRRRGRDVRAANFQRERGLVTFSGPRWELPLEAGTQDRLSWLVQLAALVGGANEALRDGAELAMWVVGARGAASHWRFEVRGRERLVLDGHEADAWWLVREPVHPYDQRVEVWLSASHGHWPLKLRQTQVPGGEPLEWLLREHTAFQPGT